MVWLQTPPWGRWLLSALIAAVAIWVEMGPEPSVSHPFAVADIAAGSVVDASNTEERTLAAGLLEPVELGGTTRARSRQATRSWPAISVRRAASSPTAGG